MFIIKEQISKSLARIKELHNFFGMSYLAFKRAKIPIDSASTINFSIVANEIMSDFYKPYDNYDGFYNPFKSSRTEQRWVKPRYGSTTLQRITKDTFSDALLHPTKSEWGWKRNYVEVLKNHLKSGLIPAFDLAVWLFRSHEWPESVTPSMIVTKLFEQFDISHQEIEALFSIDEHMTVEHWASGKAQVTEAELVALLGLPPGAEPEVGAAISYLRMRYIGPSADLIYQPGERLNIITGDNSLGKSFILENIWWVLTGFWLGKTNVMPMRNAPKNKPLITYRIQNSGQKDQDFHVNYNWDKQLWISPKKTATLSGLVIYAKFDGSFAIWDSSRGHMSNIEFETPASSSIFLNNSDIWNGLQVKEDIGRTRWVCNGLLRDWISWQTGARFSHQFNSLTACLKALSSDPQEPLTPAEPTRVPWDSQEIPTLNLPYGKVPVLNASAGIQRVIGLCYAMVWAWHEHLMICEATRREPQRRLVLLIDEVEAHLHPRWQRVIVPGILSAIRELSISLTPQIHLATHSPLVLASAEPLFLHDEDELHHLKMENGVVSLEEVSFVRRGTADEWLMSDVFSLNTTRSIEAEAAILEAKAIQLKELEQIEQSVVKSAHENLIKYIASDDSFWPRWIHFARKFGVLK
jgi:hypothetical protein